MNFVKETSFASSLAWASAVRTWAVGGRIGLISSASACWVTPSFPSTEMVSYVPTRSSRTCAVGIEKTVKVAEPIEATSPYCASPTRSNERTGFRVAILTESPTL